MEWYLMLQSNFEEYDGDVVDLNIVCFTLFKSLLWM